MLKEKAGRGEGLDESQLYGLSALIEGMQSSLQGATDQYRDDEDFLLNKKLTRSAA